MNDRVAVGLRVAGVLALVVMVVVPTSRGGTPPSSLHPHTDEIAEHLAGPPVLLHEGSADIEEKLSIVILGDGFTDAPASMDAFRAAAAEVTNELLSTLPFGLLSRAFDVHRVDVISHDAGIDVPTDCGGQPYIVASTTPGVSRAPKNPDNILQTHWCATSLVSNAPKKRFLNATNDGQALAQGFAAQAGVAPNMIIVLVNDWMFGATAWTDPGLVFVSIGQNLIGDTNPTTGDLQPDSPDEFPGVVVHEIGHLAPFQLLDEYGSQTPLTSAASARIAGSPNLALATQLAPIKWEDLLTDVVPTQGNDNCPLGAPTAVSVPPGAIGAFEGGHGFKCDVFHSEARGRMNTMYHDPFCLVCRRRIMQVLLGNELSFRPARQPLPSFPEDEIAMAPQLLLLLERLRLDVRLPGSYFLEYQMSLGGVTSSGRWPREVRFELVPGRVAEIGEVAAMLERPSSVFPVPEEVVGLSFRLIRFPPDAMDAVLVEEDAFGMEVDSALQQLMFVRERDTYRLTFSLISPMWSPSEFNRIEGQLRRR